MCGRFVQITPIPRLVKRFKVKRLAPVDKGPSYNVAPTQQILIINNEGERQLIQARWGLVPSWPKEPSIGSHMINARAETIAQKPAFRPTAPWASRPSRRKRG
ncbi:MAG: SOS response-associated peptidase family protein [Syntrophorhabdales bacterium]